MGLCASRRLMKGEPASSDSRLRPALSKASSISSAATPKVQCMPRDTASTLACGPEPQANSAPMAAAPLISPRLRDRLSNPAVSPRCCGATSRITRLLLAAWNSA